MSKIKYTNQDKLKVILGHYCNTKEIEILANCGANTALKIKNEIIDDFIKQQLELPPSDRKVLNRNSIPCDRVLKHLGLTANQITKYAKMEADLGIDDLNIEEEDLGINDLYVKEGGDNNG